MSTLTHMEKRSLEKLFGMASGYVMNFSNKTFYEFVLDSTGKNIEDVKYQYASGSKANRLRAFWKVEPDYVIAKLLNDMLELHAENGIRPEEETLFQNCRRIELRLKQETPVPEIEAITPNTAERDFQTLAKTIRDSIDKNEPESGLDRLHTFVVRYLRVICEKHGVVADRDKPLHSLLGEYIKVIREKGHIESEMTERILKYSISILEAFNKVRNDKSFAHDNRILNYEESLLIFNNISSAIRFIEAIEKKIAVTSIKVEVSNDFADDDIPF